MPWKKMKKINQTKVLVGMSMENKPSIKLMISDARNLKKIKMLTNNKVKDNSQSLLKTLSIDSSKISWNSIFLCYIDKKREVVSVEEEFMMKIRQWTISTKGTEFTTKNSKEILEPLHQVSKLV